MNIIVDMGILGNRRATMDDVIDIKSVRALHVLSEAGKDDGCFVYLGNEKGTKNVVYMNKVNCKTVMIVRGNY